MAIPFSVHELITNVEIRAKIDQWVSISIKIGTIAISVKCINPIPSPIQLNFSMNYNSGHGFALTANAGSLFSLAWTQNQNN